MRKRKYQFISNILAPLFIATILLSSCQKSKETSINNGSHHAIFKAITETPIDASTKLAITESGNKFSFKWEGTEDLTVANSSNMNSSTFSIISTDGVSATYEGDLPEVTTATANYIAIPSDLFISSATNTIRGEIKNVQEYSANSTAKYALIVARMDNKKPEDVGGELDFKTMNSFFKFSLIKGSAASGSTNTYSKMFVQNIKLQAIGEEFISGRFGIAKSGDFASDYAEKIAASSYPHVTLNCVTDQYPEGVELSSSAIDFYIAVAIGTYSQGFTVTITVKNQDGKYGVLQKSISSGVAKTLERNKIYKTPTLTVNPEDNSQITYEIVTDPTTLVDGEKYLLAAKLPNGNYVFWNGSTSSNDLATTSEYSYNSQTKTLTGEGAIEVLLTKSGSGFYVSGNDKYLYVTNFNSNRKMGLTENLSQAAVWTFGIDSRGGFTMSTTSGGKTSYLLSSSGASAVLRNYSNSTTGNYGVYLFSEKISQSSDDGGDGDDEEDSNVNYGYLELPKIPSSLNGNIFLTLYATMNSQNARNYSVLYSPTYYAQLWTAYPLCDDHMGSLSRPSSWSWNPQISQSLQTSLTKSYGSSTYSRGHHIPNGDRNGVREMQLQTFYYTNASPQIQNNFNGGIWGTLEDQIRSCLSSTDTLYIVTGPVFQTVGGNETISYLTNANDGKSLAIANYYFKVVLKVKRDSSKKITSASSIGFWFEHKAYPGENSNYANYTKSVKEIETLTGYDFFAALPEEIASAAKQNSSWNNFKNF